MATNAVTLNGSTQYGKISSIYTALQSLGGTATFEGWFKQDSTGSSSYTRFFQIGDGTTFAFYVITENATPSTGINFGANYSGTNADGYKDTGAFSNDTWFHIAAVFENGSQTKIYINGTEISYTLQNTPSGTIHDTDSGDGFFIGVDDGETTNFWDGDIGCFRIWNVARSGTEIANNKDYYLDPANETGLVLNCNVDEGSGTTLGNDVASSTDVSLIGSPSWTTGPTLTTKQYPDLTDKTSNSNDLSPGNSPVAFTTDYPFASSTGAMDLEASGSQYAYINDADQTGLDISGDFSIEFWWRAETIAINTMFVGKWDYGSSNRSYVVRLLSGNKLSVSYSSDGSAVTTITSSSAVLSDPGDIGSWIHFAVCVDVSAQSATMYKNGSSISVGAGSGSESSVYNGNAPFAIGCQFNSGTPLSFVDGAIDEVRVWNDIRTSTEISDNYQSELAGNETGLVGYWPFETLGGGTETASLSPVTASLTLPSVTATYVQVETASLSPSTASLSIPVVTATYVQVETSSLTPLTALLSITSTTATFTEVRTASLSPITASLAVVSVTATYSAVLSASLSPLTLSLSIPSVTADAGTYSASLSPVTLSVSVVDPTATYVQVNTASVSPLSLVLSVVLPDTADQLFIDYADQIINTSQKSPELVMEREVPKMSNRLDTPKAV